MISWRGPRVERCSAGLEALFVEIVLHRVPVMVAEMPGDLLRGGEPDIVCAAGDVGERGFKRAQAVGLADQIGVQRDAHHRAALLALAQQLVRAADDVPRRPSHYVSVWRPYQSLRAFNELFVRDFLYGRLARSTRGSCTASAECAAAEECVTGRCVLGTVRVHDALPLGLTYDYTTRDLLIDTDAPDLDVIVESDWKGVYMLVYRETSGLGQVALLIYSFLLDVGLGTAMHLLGRKTAE